MTSKFEAKNFFKVYFSCHSSQKMLIPRGAVLRSYEQPLTATFRNCKGQCWHVELEVDESNGNKFFNKGWRKFIDENSIKEKDFIVFSYVRCFVFDVKVIELDGCEKSVSNVLDERGNVLAEDDADFWEAEHFELELEEEDDDDNDDEDDNFREEEEEEEDEEEEEEVDASNKGCDHHEEFATVNLNEGTTSMEVEDEEIDPAKYVKDYYNPHFVVRTRRARDNELHVPARVIKDYGLTLEDKEKIILRGPDKRKSIEEIVKWKDGRTCISGWGSLCRRNGVDQQHDKCICEFHLGKEQEDEMGQKMKYLKVHIIRRRKHN